MYLVSVIFAKFGVKKEAGFIICAKHDRLLTYPLYQNGRTNRPDLRTHPIVLSELRIRSSWETNPRGRFVSAGTGKLLFFRFFRYGFGMCWM